MRKNALSCRYAATVFLAAFLLSGACMAESSLALSGRFEHRTDPASLEMLGGLVCFYPSPESAKLLPRPPSDTRLAWFCFTNTENARKRLGIPGKAAKGGCGYAGQATVRVVKYTPYLGEGDDFDTALLQSASHISKTAVIPCQ